jgi:hypothetical protein
LPVNDTSGLALVLEWRAFVDRFMDLDPIYRNDPKSPLIRDAFAAGWDAALARATHEEAALAADPGRARAVVAALAPGVEISRAMEGPEHHTGKPCIWPGCDLPAGTAWSPLWCVAHYRVRTDRITADLRRLLRSPDPADAPEDRP